MLKRLYSLNKLPNDFYKGFDLPKVKKYRLIDVPSEEDVELIIAQTLTRGFTGVRDKAILEVYYATGIRRAELTKLDFRDVDYKNQSLKIRGGKGGGDRQVPMAPRTIYAIKEYLEKVRPVLASLDSCEALFFGMTGNRIQLSALTELAGMYVERSGVGVKGACHVFRYAAASHMLKHGADIRYIQEFLGHEHLLSTQIYTRVYQEDLKRVYSLTHPAAQSVGKYD